MKNILIILFITFNSIAFGQSIELENIELFKTEITKSDTTEINIFGKKNLGNVYNLKSKVNVQVSCSVTSGEWEDKVNEYKISIVEDSNCELLDSIYDKISKYWIKQEKWSNKYNANGDFSTLPVRDGFYKINKKLIIPMVKSEHEREGSAFQVFWYKNHLYKVELIKSGGYGGLSSFIEQNLEIKEGKRIYKLSNLVRYLDETKKLINKKKNCS
ncbi:hypothetical protein [Allomuricauda sp. F6463D]|uniref:hypothetical protein n=1 Tax=Allomuricauda sp. F6463D TaxID=2926409 RepID=UPI001FF693B4|nr:hypothetical protein [Muricauda sp. F6463D]MCK0162233.1 hypothetical protein [Muricauda sp. F6463D]